jgi:hypothetical protein
MIDDVVEKFLNKGINGFIRDVKEIYKENRRQEPYTISEISQTVGNYLGRMILLDSGGCLVLEHDIDNNVYNAQFRLITPNRRGIMGQVTRALDGIVDKKKYYSYKPTYVGYKTKDDLIEDVCSNRIFRMRAF